MLRAASFPVVVGVVLCRGRIRVLQGRGCMVSSLRYTLRRGCAQVRVRGHRQDVDAVAGTPALSAKLHDNSLGGPC
jgi:hypothetical protein